MRFGRTACWSVSRLNPRRGYLRVAMSGCDAPGHPGYLNEEEEWGSEAGQARYALNFELFTGGDALFGPKFFACFLAVLVCGLFIRFHPPHIGIKERI